METLACNFHDENSEIIGFFELKGGDDAESAKWIDLSSELMLFASHKDFLHNVAVMHNSSLVNLSSIELYITYMKLK